MIFERPLLFLARLDRALRYYSVLRYSWRMAWFKAGSDYSSLAR